MPPTRSVLRSLILVPLFAVVARAATDQVYVPLPVADRVAKIETTELDIGEPALLFDHNAKTLIRTPSINPAYVEVLFDEPITFECIRVQVWELSDWSIAAANNLEDLRSQTGSYRMLVPARENGHKGWGEFVFPKPVTAQAFRLDTRRKRGDDYVHISEIQFCRPGTLDAIEIRRVIDRRAADQPEGQESVDDAIEIWEKTIVWLKATGRAGDVDIELAEKVTWTAGDGLEPWGDEPGMFHVKRAGEYTLTARVDDFARNITILAKPRNLRNREPDLDVLFVERLPRIDFDGPNGGWPEEGSDITWRAHVYNWGVETVPARYTWTLDDEVVKTGEIDIPVGPPATDATTIDLPWKWTQDRHTLRFDIEPLRPMDELITPNNTITFATNAITVGFYVEQSVWEFHHEHQYRLPTKDGNSFADWAQRMTRKWNAMFAEAVYPEYPDGIVERVRFDRLVIVPDFALPLHGGIPSNNPNLHDKTIDMQWGHEERSILPPYELPENHWWSPERTLKVFETGRVAQKKEDPPFWCGLGFIHEMAHARYLVDAYGFNVHSGHGEDINNRLIRVTVDGRPILGRYLPLGEDIQHWRKYPGQMGGNYWEWSVFDAMCWNRVAGQRARGGNCNSPPTIGEFLQDIPERLVYEFVDQDGNPLANADVWIYHAEGTGKNWYSKLYRDEPGIKTHTDRDGRAEFDRTLWSANGKIRHTYGHSNGVALIRVTYEGQHYFLFEEVTSANIAYNLGHHDEYTFRRQITLREGEPAPDTWDVNNTWEPAGVGFGKR